MRNGRSIVLLGAVLLFAIALRHPSADIKVLTHDAADLSPRRVQAVVDLGIVGVSVLVTWTAERLTR